MSPTLRDGDACLVWWGRAPRPGDVVVARLPGGLPPFFGRLLRIMHDDDADITEVERELRAHGFLRPGIDVDLDALHTFLAPLAEPSKVDSFKFSREWLRGEATRVTDMRASNITRKFNVPPSYVLIHRVSTAGIGVLCQLECEGEFRAEVLKWVPGYFDPAPAALEDPETPVSASLRLVVRYLAAHGQALGGLFLADDVHDGVDQGQVRKGLREVTQVAAGPRVDLLAVEQQRAGVGQDLLADVPGALVLADFGQRRDQPERADGERPLLPR